MIFFLHLSCNFIPTNEQLKMLARSCGCIVRSSQTTWVNEKRESHYRIKCYWLYLLCKRIVYSKKIQQHAICAHVMIPSCLDFSCLKGFSSLTNPATMSVFWFSIWFAVIFILWLIWEIKSCPLFTIKMCRFFNWFCC